jgi:1,6-anhydro-N-acetylmuramate kinase
MRRKDTAMDTTELFKRHDRQQAQAAAGNLDVKVLGIRCRSGLNKLDFALVHYRQQTPDSPLRVEFLKVRFVSSPDTAHTHKNWQAVEISIPFSIRNPIMFALREQRGNPALTVRLNMLLGQMFSSGIKFFCQNFATELTDLDLIGAHLPILIRPSPYTTNSAEAHSTAWTAIIASETGLTVISDFSIVGHATVTSRISPVSFVDSLLLKHPHKFRACLDIDELANITFIPPYIENSTETTLSRNCGPGSLFIDYAMRYCTSNDQEEDNDGQYAVNGRSNQDIVDWFLRSHDYLRASPPLNMTREMFGDHDAQHLIDECLYAKMSKADIVATITRATAGSILNHYRRLLALYFPNEQINEIFICGPSASNPNLIDFLEVELPSTVITKPLDDVGIPGHVNHAFCYAHLALEALLGQATYVPDRSKPPPAEVVRGRIVPGQNWEQLATRVKLFSKGISLKINKDLRVAGNLEAAVKGLDLG